MDYVNKKDFEAAILVLKRALKNGQIEEGIGDDARSPLAAIFFSHNTYGEYTFFSPEQCFFMSPDIAAKKKLHLLRQSLKISREDIGKNQKALEKLEKEEQALSALVPTLKE